MKNLLITGSNGFIGKHLCRYLRERDCYMVGLGRSESAHSDVNEYICCDLGNDDVSSSLSQCSVKFDAVIHLATDSRDGEYAVGTVTANCSGTQKLLDLCHERNIPAFIQLSSLPLIGKPIKLPVTEQHPMDPPTLYHATKVFQEYQAKLAEESFGIRTCSFRLASPLGKDMRPNTIFSVFLRKALANEQITVFGKGTRKQTYIYIDDVSEAIYRAIDSEAHGVFNLTSSILVSNMELAQIIKKTVGSSSEIVLSGDDYMDDYVWDTDISKMKKELGFVPQHSSLEEIINKILDR